MKNICLWLMRQNEYLCSKGLKIEYCYFKVFSHGNIVFTFCLTQSKVVLLSNIEIVAYKYLKIRTGFFYKKNHMSGPFLV